MKQSEKRVVDAAIEFVQAQGLMDASRRQLGRKDVNLDQALRLQQFWFESEAEFTRRNIELRQAVAEHLELTLPKSKRRERGKK